MLRKWALLTALLGGLATLASAQAPPPDSPLRRQFDLEVRSATLSEVLDQLARAIEAPLASRPPLADQPVTIYAEQIDAAALESGLAALLGGQWERRGVDPAGERHVLVAQRDQDRRIADLRRRRSRELADRWLAAADRIQQARPDDYAAQLRQALITRRPEFPPERVAEVTLPYLRQSLLLGPLRLPGAAGSLADAGVYWVDARALSPQEKTLFTAFAAEQRAAAQPVVVADGSSGVQPASAESLPVQRAAASLERVASQVEYRVLYGDRWSGPILQTRVGSPDDWATATLAGSLFDLPEARSLTRGAGPARPDAHLDERFEGRIELGALTLDEALIAVAKAAEVRVLADAFRRPEVYRPTQPALVLQGYTLRQSFDRLAERYGCYWWAQDGWYLFRHREWVDETRVAVPDRVARALGEAVAGADGALPEEAIRTLAGLSVEQLMTLHLLGAADGRPSVDAGEFDWDELDWTHAALGLLRTCTAEQLAAAADDGVGALEMSAAQVAAFQRLGEAHGFAPDLDQAGSWSLRVASSLRRTAAGNQPIYTGRVEFHFAFGPEKRRTTRLALRFPAPP